MITVLVLASSPLDQAQLHLGKEFKVIQHTRDSARNRDQFRVVSCPATTPDDLRSYLLEHSPTMIHFCGHGAGPSGLCFEDSDGSTHLVDGSSLAKLFHLVNTEVKCVVLSACYSEEQARPISEHIDFVVGMSSSIGDQAALKFTEGFYQAIWSGRSFEKAFKFGCSAIDTSGFPDEQVPTLLRSPRLGGLRLPYGERIQQFENFLVQYLNSAPEERVELTIEGTSGAEMILDHYRGIRFLEFSSATVLGVEEIHGSVVEVAALITDSDRSSEHIYYLEETPKGIRIHWEATVGRWGIPAKTLAALGCDEPVVVRALASLSSYYNYGFEPSEFVSIDVRDSRSGFLSCFLAKNHSQFDEVVSLLKDGRSHRLSLLVQHWKPGKEVAKILKLLSHSWVIDTTVAA